MTTVMIANSSNFEVGRRLAVLSIAISAVLAGANLTVSYIARSASVVATGFEFGGDVLASGLVLVGMTLASKPADKEHPYGHGRIELLSGLAVGLILAAGGIGICFRSLQRVSEVHAPPRVYSAYPLVFAILVRSVMSVIKFRVGRGIGSISVIADAWNDAVDVLSAVAALCALVLTLFNPSKFLMADHYGGFAVGLFVIYTGLRVLRDASLELIDTMPPTTLIEKVRATAMQVHGVVGVEKVLGRKIGLQHQLELHLEVNPTISVSLAHEIAANFRARIRADLPEIADVVVHIEPHGLGGK